MNWRLKGIVQGTLSAIPGGTVVNDALQRTTGELRNVEATVDSKVVDDWAVLARQLRELKVEIRDAVLLEVGTGWLPVLPLCFSLAGARICHTFDRDRHLSVSLTARGIARLRVHLPLIAEAAGARLEDVERRYDAMSRCVRVATAFGHAAVHYHAPADASRCPLPPRSVDAVFSNSVLEHVRARDIGAILRETARILKRDGVSLHSVNCGDHYAYFDRSISPINYLKYSDRQWRPWNNGLLYQNRLRPVDFLELAEGAGLEVVLSRFAAKEKLLKLLPTLDVSAQFRKYAPEQLCATNIDFAGRPR